MGKMSDVGKKNCRRVPFESAAPQNSGIAVTPLSKKMGTAKPFPSVCRRTQESSRGGSPLEPPIVPSGVYGGRGAIFAAENPIFQSKNPYLAVFAPGNLKDFSKNW